MKSLAFDCSEGSHQFNVSPEDCNSEIKLTFPNKIPPSKYCKVTIEVLDIPTAQKKYLYRIPGHENCYYGDCYNDCHCVSCAIHQGFAPEPTIEECEKVIDLESSTIDFD